MEAMGKVRKYGARVIDMGKGTIVIKQTVLKDKRHILDTSLPDGKQREAFMDVNDDAKIAEAIRRALKGGLERSL